MQRRRRRLRYRSCWNRRNVCGRDRVRCRAGVEVTASHNPIDYNGMKIVGRGSKPLSDNEFDRIKDLEEENNFFQSQKTGSVLDKKEVARAAYIEKVLEFVDLLNLRPLKILINSGNGAAGPTVDALHKKLKKKVKTNLVFVHHDPTQTSPMVFQIPYLRKIDLQPQMLLSMRMPILALPLTETLIDAFSLTILASLFLGSTWWDCWLKYS